jgi:hypothetical protein
MTIYTGGPRTRTSKLISEFEVSTPQVMKTFALDALTYSPTSSLLRAQEQVDAQRGIMTTQGLMDPLRSKANQPEITPVMTVEEQQEIIDAKQVPLKPEEGLRRATLELLIERKQEELAHQSVMERATTGQMVAGFGVGVLASLVDPINVASAFVPVIGPARYAASLARQTSRTGRALVRARVGAAEGFVGAGLVEPIVYTQAQNEQADYTMSDSLLNFAFGTVLGGGLHMGIGAISDGIKARKNAVATGEVAKSLAEMTPQQREDLFRANMGLAVDDRMGVAPFRLTDLLGNERLTDAGLTDPGTPIRAEFEISETTVVTNQAIPKDIDAIAREANPGVFVELDAARTEQASLRQQLERVGADRDKSAAVAAIDEEIGALRERQANTTKRNTKKIEKQIVELETKRASLIETETPVMQKLRERLMMMDEKLRDIAPEVTNTLRQAEHTARDMPTSFGPEQTTTTFRGTGIKFDEAEMARLRSVENLRLADTQFTARVDEELRPEKFEDIAEVEESFQLETDRLNEVIDQADEAVQPTLKEAVNTELEAAKLEIDADDAYARGLRAMAVCATRRG